MLQFFKWFFGLFSPYVNRFERKVDKFFKHIKSTDSLASIKKELLELMQENLIIVNVWMEKKYRGYKYLNKKTRKGLYANVEKIVAKFQEESSSAGFSLDDLKALLGEAKLIFPNGDEEKVKYLFQIMNFLRPGKYYNYIRTASFGKLLRDPDQDKLAGDCNQIVTFYAYLFSLKFPLENLQIKLLPEHVCLHFRGIDIEATNGTFQKYEDDTQILPISEIISTNLLDLMDFREEAQEIHSRDLVKSAQLAYAISSLKPLVAKNLNIAYRNLAIEAMRGNDFETAIFYFSKTEDRELLRTAYHNAAIYFMNANNFEKARYFAGKSGDAELEKNIRRNEGIYYYQNNRLDKALEVFSYLNDAEMKKAVYQKMYNDLVKKVATVRTIADAKRYENVYKKMLDLAGKMGDAALEKSVRDTLSKI